MNNIFDLKFNNTYRKLPESFYHIVSPKPFDNPFIISFNKKVSELIGLDPNVFRKDDIADYLCHKKEIPGSEPIAMYYTGHQFGVYNPDIGDGRAILLGEVLNANGEKWDLHLKGSGRTNYSRQFDGRAVLRSTIREYLCSEAMHYLGIPSTRALCIIGSDEKVEREKTELGAMLIRVAKSHVRFGSFEAFYYSGQHEELKLLTDYVIENSFEHLSNEAEKYKLFISEVAEITAKLVANWQAFGFTHGVMNTDNMSIVGDTLDYGPFGFLEQFNPEFIPNHSDHFGRYSYRNQPSIAYWNLQKLTQSLNPIIKHEHLMEALDKFRSVYSVTYFELMARKFGFNKFFREDKKFIESALELLEKNGVDFAIFFRNLSDFTTQETFSKNGHLIELNSIEEFSGWFKEYRSRLEKEKSEDGERRKAMNLINPKFILRNYIAEQAIRKAEDENDYSEIEKVTSLLMNPYDDQKEMDEYAKPAPDWAKELVVSCSS